MHLRQVHATSEAVAHTYSVKLALQQLLTRLVDAETGERGYIITNEAGYLQPYNGARQSVLHDIAEIRKLSADVHEHGADLERLSHAVELKLGELDSTIRIRRETGFEAAHAQVVTNVGMQTMDELRAIVGRMEAREDAILARSITQAAESYRSAVWTSVMTTTLALLATAALFVGTLRYTAMQADATRAAEVQQAQLREALNQKDDFVAVVSHELRTPANTIAGWAHMLADGTMQSDRAGSAISAISRSADTLRQLIDDLMDTSQLVSGRMRLTIASLYFQEVVRDAIDTVQLSADNKGVVLTEAISPDLPMIRGDAGRLKQVVCNLLANAIKFTPKDGCVDVKLVSTGTDLRLEVRDTGDGIDSAFLPHVFERYRQATTAQRHRGLGLGLAIVRHLVELHGGTVTAASAGLGRGATFAVQLPLAGAPSEAETPAKIREA